MLYLPSVNADGLRQGVKGLRGLKFPGGFLRAFGPDGCSKGMQRITNRWSRQRRLLFYSSGVG